MGNGTPDSAPHNQLTHIVLWIGYCSCAWLTDKLLRFTSWSCWGQRSCVQSISTVFQHQFILWNLVKSDRWNGWKTSTTKENLTWNMIIERVANWCAWLFISLHRLFVLSSSSDPQHAPIRYSDIINIKIRIFRKAGLELLLSPL